MSCPSLTGVRPLGSTEQRPFVAPLVPVLLVPDESQEVGLARDDSIHQRRVENTLKRDATLLDEAIFERAKDRRSRHIGKQVGAVRCSNLVIHRQLLDFLQNGLALLVGTSHVKQRHEWRVNVCETDFVLHIPVNLTGVRHMDDEV